jgi:formate dehydrogenase beta subunit
LIAAGRYSDAYMINWRSNVFPGILGRTCDRPCEPACRRVRVEKEPVAICRLKRVAADYKDDIRARLPRKAAHKNGKRIALVGGGPASLTVTRDLAPLGYTCVVFDADPKAGGMIRTQIPRDVLGNVPQALSPMSAWGGFPLSEKAHRQAALRRLRHKLDDNEADCMLQSCRRPA